MPVTPDAREARGSVSDSVRVGQARVRHGRCVAAASLGWSLFESQWVERGELDVLVAGCTPDLDGLRILHLSDFHLGTLSLNVRAVRKAEAWARERPYDLACVTGDLLSRRRGAGALRETLAALRPRHGTFTRAREPRHRRDARPVR